MAIFTTIKCIGGWVELPFQHEGDKDHKIFHFDCIVDAKDYDSLALSTSITDASAASVAGLDEYPTGVWPVSGDGTCYFVGDSKPALFRGPVVRFTRKFANVPSSRTRGIGSYSHTWPALMQWDGNVHSLNAEAFDVGSAGYVGPPPTVTLRPELTTTSPAEITYAYTYATAISSVTKDTLWEPYWINTPSRTYEFAGVASGNLLVDRRVSTVGNPEKTVPDVSTYQSSFINSTFVIVSSAIKHYMGNIYVKETIKALAQ